MNLILKLRRREFVRCLVDLNTYALTYSLLDEAELLTRCLHQLRPKLEQLDFFDGWIAALRGDWRAASMIANSSVERTPEWPYASVLLAYCQFATGDGIWRNTAQHAVGMSEPGEGKRFMQMLLGELDASDSGVDPGILAKMIGNSSSIPLPSPNAVQA